MPAEPLPRGCECELMYGESCDCMELQLRAEVERYRMALAEIENVTTAGCEVTGADYKRMVGWVRDRARDELEADRAE